MDDNQQQNNIHRQAPVDPVPTRGFLADSNSPNYVQPAQVQVPPATSNYNGFSLAIFIILLLTFFSPLGSVLFLPLVLVGLFSAYKQTQASNAATYSSTATVVAPVTPKTVGSAILKIFVIIFAVIGIGILGIIGLLFLLFSTGGGRMGS